MCNHAAEKYANSKFDGDFDYGIDLVLNDGSVHEQFCTGRLWAGYRGMSVLPCLLRSALMALENYLIGIAENQESSKRLPEVLDYILIKSNSVLTTAVIASLAVGFPEISGDAVWPLLRSPDLFSLDSQRSHHESYSSSVNWHRNGLSRDVFSAIYADERDKSNQRKWRKEDLEFLVGKLQFTSMRDKVYEVIDTYFKRFAEEGPDAENWKFRLSRIDLRDCKQVVDEVNNCIRFVPSVELEPDLKEKSEAAQKQMERINLLAKLNIWSDKAFGGEITGSDYYQDYNDILLNVRNCLDVINGSSDSEETNHWNEGVVKATAVLIRDYAASMDRPDLSWCIDFLLEAIVKSLISDNQINVSFFSRASISVTQILPLFLNYFEGREQYHIKKLVVIALTHQNGDFRKSIAIGIRKYLWNIDPDFAQRCFEGALEYARLQLECSRARPSIFDEDQAQPSIVPLQRLRVRMLKSIQPVDAADLSFETYNRSYLLIAVLLIPDNVTRQQFTSLFMRMTSLIQDANIADRDNRTRREHNLNLEEKYLFMQSYTNYLWVLPESDRNSCITALTSRLTDDLDIIDDLLSLSLYQSERTNSSYIFWHIWDQIASSVQANLDSILSDWHSPREGEQLVLNLLFSKFPLDEKKHIEELRGILLPGHSKLLQFAYNTCSNSIVFEYFARLILKIPSLFFGDGLFILAEHAKFNINVLDGTNTVYYLEHLLRNFLISNHASNTIRSNIYDASFNLLTAMIEKGSTIGYFLREHLLSLKRVS